MKSSIKTHKTYFVFFLLSSLILTNLSYADFDSFSATLIDFDGDVSILKGDTNEWIDVEIYMPIQKEDNILTGEASYAEIFIDDGSTIKIEESSEINLRELTFDEDAKKVEIKIFLKAGILLSNIVEAIQRSPSVQIYTTTAVAGVRGTEFVVDVTDPEETSIGVFNGEVEAFGLDEDGNAIEYESVSITEGYQTTVVRNVAPVRPFVHKRRMLIQKKPIEALRIRAIQRRKNIQEIIIKRKMIKRRIILRRRIINNQFPPPGTPTRLRSDPTSKSPKPPLRKPPIRRPRRR